MKQTMEPMELLTSSTPYSVYNFHLPQSLKKNAEQLCWEYNQLPPGQEERRREILKSCLVHVIRKPLSCLGFVAIMGSISILTDWRLSIITV